MKNPRPVKAGGVLVGTTRRGPVTRLRTRPPVGEQGEEVGDADDAIAVEVGRAVGTFAPRGGQYDQITAANVAVGIDFRKCSFPFDNDWMVETVRFLEGLASSVVASAAL